jgi:hypothetical protein
MPRLSHLLGQCRLLGLSGLLVRQWSIDRPLRLSGLLRRPGRSGR